MAVMTEAERQQFLSEPHVGVIAIARPDAGPLAVPVWYAYDPGGNVEVIMGADSVKARLIDAAGRFTITAQQEALPYKYVMAEGPVVATRPADVDGDTLPMACRYLGDEMGAQYAEGSGGEGSIVVVMTPERWYSTDYGK